MLKNFLRLGIAAVSLSAVCGAALAGPTLDSLGGAGIEFKFSGVTTEFFTQAGTNETTWGAGNITSITGPSSGGAPVLWSSGNDGDFLSYMIFGIADLSSNATSATSFDLYNNGAVGAGAGALSGGIYIDIIQRASTPTMTVPSARTGYNSYPGVTEGALYLRLLMIPGITADDPATVANEGTDATLVQHVGALTLPTTGNGTFYANVIAGSALSKFDTNGFTTLLGTSADMFGIFDLRDNSAASGGDCAAGTTDCFLGLVRDPLIANAAPEPGSLALVGLGLGMFGLRRRKS